MENITITDLDLNFLSRAAEISMRSVDGGGGPFGAVIVKNGKILAEASNSVTLDNDPTAHAEVNAIRKACGILGCFKLNGCYVYSSCEPCPMCLSALYWAGVERIYYGNTKEDAEAIGFGDKFIYEELDKDKNLRSIPCIRVMQAETIKAFDAWNAKTDKIEY